MNGPVLAIETSCDETAAAVLAETSDASRPWAILSSVVASQADIHRGWGGVVPELASRQHVRDICGVVDAALEKAQVSAADLSCVAVTQGPGLVGSLLVGVAFAKSFAWARGLPVIPVHHLAGHIESLVLAHGELPLPSAVLVVSGGHTSLYSIPEAGRYQLVGRTRDDAAGEAYDKVAKLLGLGYPGGPAIDRVARDGNDRAYDFPTARLTHADRNAPQQTAPAGMLPDDVARRVDFSFSGLKTAVSRLVRELTGSPPAGTTADARDAGRCPVAAADRGHQRQLPARGRVGAARSHVRGGALARRAQRRHLGRRVGEQPAADRGRAARASATASRCSCRRCRCRPTMRR